MKLRTYKGILVGKGSALAEALEKSEADASKVYKETSLRFEALYGKEAASWFYNKHKECV